MSRSLSLLWPKPARVRPHVASSARFAQPAWQRVLAAPRSLRLYCPSPNNSKIAKITHQQFPPVNGYELRKLGNEALQCWADRAVQKATATVRQQQPALQGNGKKK